MRIVFFGAPGVGKGTFAKLLSKKERIKHINVGNILRKEINKNTILGNEIKKFVNQGFLVPDVYILNIVKTEIEKIEKCQRERERESNRESSRESGRESNRESDTENEKNYKNVEASDNYRGFILDGFPRNIYQSKELIKMTDINLFINIDLPKHIIIKKLLGRRVCEICDNNFNVASINENSFEMPPLLPPSDCTMCKGKPKLTMRTDDTEETIHHRLQSYENSYIPILDFFKKKNCNFVNFQLHKGVKDFNRLYNIIKQYC